MRQLSAVGVVIALAAQPINAQQQDPLKLAVAMARGLGAETCSLQSQSMQEDWTKPELFNILHIRDFDQVEEKYKLVRVPCWMAAYNQGDIYVLIDPDGHSELVSFAVPTYKVVYADEDNPEIVESITITGYTAKTSVVLSDFDAGKREISEYYKIRGLGDASTSAVWRFEDGTFVLKSYSIDASYDGEINPTELVRFGETE